MLIESKIVNVVATAALGQNVDLEEISKFKEIFHDSEVYGGRVAYFKTVDMQGKVSIFSSGKLISVGTKSEDNALHELNMAKNFLVNKGIISDHTLESKIRNIVIIVDFGKTVNLEDMSLREMMIYEPEQFPAGILRILEPYKASALIFASGKVIITGLTKTSQIETIIARVKRLLKEVF